MLVKMIKSRNNGVVLLLSLIVASCGGGGGSSSSGSPATVSSGDLVMTTDISSDSDVVLGGSHKYEVSLVGSENLSEPVVVHVTSSNNNVASIIENTCATSDLHIDGTSQSCGFYVKGVGAGSATISVTSNDYPSITYQLNVSQQWGTFSTDLLDNRGQRSISEISFGGDDLYVRSGSLVYKSNGSSWEGVGDGDAIDYDADTAYTVAKMVSDDTHVCVSAGYFNSYNEWTNVKCSTNGASWQNLPRLNGWEMSSSSLYNGKLYILSRDGSDNFAVMSCPVDNCVFWQQEGSIFTDFNGGANTVIFESHGFLKNDIGVHYQDESGIWQIQGLYASSDGGYIAAGNNGVAFIPFVSNANLPSVLQPAYYNSNINIGGNFTQVSDSILVESFVGTTSIAMENNNLFITPRDGNIYLSTNVSESWSPWVRIGDNNPALSTVYVHDNKVYSYEMSSSVINSQVYVYTLD